MVNKNSYTAIHFFPSSYPDPWDPTSKRHYMAYFLVHSRAVASYRARSVLYRCAMSGTRGSSGLGSVSIEQIESRTAQRNKDQRERSTAMEIRQMA